MSLFFEQPDAVRITQARTRATHLAGVVSVFIVLSAYDYFTFEIQGGIP